MSRIFFSFFLFGFRNIVILQMSYVLTYISSDCLMWFRPLYSSNITNSTNQIDSSQIFQLTPDKTILYLNLNDVVGTILSPVVLQLQALASSKNSEANVLLIINVKFQPFGNDSCENHHDIICAEYSLEAECNASCSFNSGGSMSCQWIHEG